MRWKFIDPTNETEVAYKRQKLAAISEWWASFAENSDALLEMGRNSKLMDIADWVNQNLAKVDPALWWDVSLRLNENFFVITPEADHGMRPLVDAMIEAAPPIAGWRFGTYREPHVDKIEELSDSRIEGDFSDLRFIAHPRDSHSVDLVFLYSKFKKDNDQKDLATCFVITELMVGEELMDKLIGIVQTRSFQRSIQEKIVNLFGKTQHDPTEGSRPIDELFECLKKYRQDFEHALPDTPYCNKEFGEYTGMFIKPGQETQPSRFTFTTALPGVISAINNKSLFYSEQFSKRGERFCYIKASGMEDLQSSVDARGQVEDKIDAVLRAEGLGCAFGGGAGPDSAFIDLILLDVDKAVPLLRQIAAEWHFSDKCWLLFHDSSWSYEWIGLTASSPVPEGAPGDW